jgi:hypothetical protein
MSQQRQKGETTQPTRWASRWARRFRSSQLRLETRTSDRPQGQLEGMSIPSLYIDYLAWSQPWPVRVITAGPKPRATAVTHG